MYATALGAMIGDTAARVVVTGSAGFIGSQTCMDLLHAGNEVVVIDDYSNGRPAALQRVSKLNGKFIQYIGLTCATIPRCRGFSTSTRLMR